MASIGINGAVLGTTLQQLLMCDEIVPGSDLGYQLCKSLFLYHTLGAKIVEAPIALAMSQRREIAVSAAPEDSAALAFEAEWEALLCDQYIFDHKRTSRIYGVSSLALLVNGEKPDQPIDLGSLREKDIRFSVFDPLNTAGSLTINQNPGSFAFQVPVEIRVAGETYHPSRSISTLNGSPVYLAWNPAAFGYVGFSAYQRALFALKSFINSQQTDDLIVTKAGVLIAKIEQQGSIIDAAMSAVQGFKRGIIKEAQTYNVISVAPTEFIESIDMTNIDGPFGMARTDILKNIATAADMPAKLLENEALIEGFGEGTEDAKMIAGYAERFRREMKPIYDFMDKIVMYRAWTPEFYESIQARFPEQYGDVKYETAFVQWQNSFVATWPSLIREPESELVKVDDVKFKDMIALAEILIPVLDPDNKALLLEFIQDNTNENKRLFPNPLRLDVEKFRDYTEEQGEKMDALAMQPDKEPGEPKPFSRES